MPKLFFRGQKEGPSIESITSFFVLLFFLIIFIYVLFF